MRQRRGMRPSLFRKALLPTQAKGDAIRPADEGKPPFLIHISNPTAFDGQSLIMLELTDEASARSVAQRIARETGRRVTVRNADMIDIQTIPAAKIQ